MVRGAHLKLTSAVALALACHAAALPAQPGATPALLAWFARETLATHNAARAAVGVPPLQWDPGLAVGATAYAAQLAQIRELVHSPRAGRPNISENLAEVPANYSPAQMVQLWIDERRYFIPGIFPNVSTTGNWMDVAHYTQLIWPTTTYVGCGYAPGGGFYWVVCRYSPSGNKDGKPVGYRVLQGERG